MISLFVASVSPVHFSCVDLKVNRPKPPMCRLSLCNVLCICSVSQAPERVSAESTINVHIPPALKQAAKKTSKVLCTFFKNNSLFQVQLNLAFNILI